MKPRGTALQVSPVGIIFRLCLLTPDLSFLPPIGLSVWRKYSTEDGVNPDVVLVGIGVEVTVEIIAAAKLLQKEGVRVRVVNVVCLSLSFYRGDIA